MKFTCKGIYKRLCKMQTIKTDCDCDEETPVKVTNTTNNAYCRTPDSVESVCVKCARCRSNDSKYYIVSLACISCVILFLCIVVVRYQTYMCMSNFDQFDAKLRNLQYQLTLLQRQNRKEQRQRYKYKFLERKDPTVKSYGLLRTSKYVYFDNEKSQEETVIRDRNEVDEGKRIRAKPHENIAQRNKRSPKSYRNLRRLKKKCKRKKGHIFMHIEGRKGRESRDDGIFHKWKVSDWAYDTTLTDLFSLTYNDGTVTVKKGGVYIIYSQVTMIGRPNQGFYVQRFRKNVKFNDEDKHDKLAVCYLNYATHNETNGNDHSKLLTCSTMGIFHLFDNDTIYLRHTSSSKSMASFHSNASFFGLVMLGDNNYMKLLKECKTITSKKQ